MHLIVNWRLSVLTVLIGITLAVFAQKSDGAEKPGPFVSAIAVVAVPDRFSDLKICVSGWLMVQLEDGKVAYAYLFPSPDHARAADFPSSIVIDAESLTAAVKARYSKLSARQLNGAYIILTGVFFANKQLAPGNLGAGEIRDIVEVSTVNAYPAKAKNIK